MFEDTPRAFGGSTSLLKSVCYHKHGTYLPSWCYTLCLPAVRQARRTVGMFDVWRIRWTLY